MEAIRKRPEDGLDLVAHLGVFGENVLFDYGDDCAQGAGCAFGVPAIGRGGGTGLSGRGLYGVLSEGRAVVGLGEECGNGDIGAVGEIGALGKVASAAVHFAIAVDAGNGDARGGGAVAQCLPVGAPLLVERRTSWPP